MLGQPRGTSDTSRIATDHINNPNAINAIFLAERERSPQTRKWPAARRVAWRKGMFVPHILKDGADSVSKVPMRFT
jgi:hypothetical protein